jgi:hypothetical protein
MGIETAITSRPWVVAVLGIALIGWWYYQRSLTLTEYREWQRAKTLLFPILDPVSRARGRPLVIESHGEPERVYETLGPRAVASVLVRGGLEPHLASTLKELPGNGGYALYQLVYTHDNGKQTEVALFRRDGGGTVVHVHLETQFTDIPGHWGDPVEHGDPRNVLGEVSVQDVGRTGTDAS